MGMIYGHKWSSQYGHEDDGTWLFGLQAFTPDDLGRGVQRCIEHRDDWPPSLPEFAARCKDVREPMYKTFLPVLTKRADPVKARKHLANMRSKIGSAPRVDDEEAEARRKERVEAANEYCRRLEAQWRIENTYYPHNGQD